MVKDMFGRNNMNVYIVIGIAICGIVLLCMILYYRHKQKQTLQFLLATLDTTLSGHMVDTLYDESINSAIIERLNRILQISNLQKNNAQKERDNVKSLVSDISHQVRTPLSNIVLYAGLLNEQVQDKEIKHVVKLIQTQSDKLDFLVKELVKASRIEQDMIQVKCDRTSISDIIQTSCQLVEVQALEKQINIQYSEQEGVCYADIRWSSEAIGNVLDNAIKYSPHGSTIHIETITYDSFLCVRIQDEGIGIDESQQGLIFQRFYRASNADTTQGFGIGLYLVREVLHKQGGYVKVVSKPNEGSTFQLYFRRNDM